MSETPTPENGEQQTIEVPDETVQDTPTAAEQVESGKELPDLDADDDDDDETDPESGETDSEG